MMDWNPITKEEQLGQIIRDSYVSPQLIFKHSSRCSTSAMALGRMERNWHQAGGIVTPHFLDLLSHRNVSDAISETFGVEHESPQVLLIHEGVCTYNTSHNDISLSGITEVLQS